MLLHQCPSFLFSVRWLACVFLLMALQGASNPNDGLSGPTLNSDFAQQIPTNCVGSFWPFASSHCSVTCGEGTQLYRFVISVNATNGGRPCPYAGGYTLAFPCARPSCGSKDPYNTPKLTPSPSLSTSETVSSTAALSSTTSISKSVSSSETKHTARPGVVLPQQWFPTNGSQNPVPSVNCVGYFAPQSCSASCAGGVQMFTFSIVTSASGNGLPCQFRAGYTETRQCNTQLCPTTGDACFTYSCPTMYTHRPNATGISCGERGCSVSQCCTAEFTQTCWLLMAACLVGGFLLAWGTIGISVLVRRVQDRRRRRRRKQTPSSPPLSSNRVRAVESLRPNASRPSASGHPHDLIQFDLVIARPRSVFIACDGAV